jgi:hypothetical protein
MDMSRLMATGPDPLPVSNINFRLRPKGMLSMKLISKVLFLFPKYLYLSYSIAF